ncbi:MAG: hypothetical protein A2660_01835 [Candidatus Doudnabacteria bacterium RIFCSPHIGHO2_01_FULL_45_18]|uniref:AtpZ/AtpI family protein n=1 Tax=Candidatus Doudnabacteria bacterium RIFCSPHIGHO2_01_FULL_45_18 TaxID=1817823 RepID=A0A1F5NS23_9BACT|nr:MAG: hypothetical protein A2660_01835 [Candidatus Doudnabacteria bacterium RIFCSPHIGHO2_01_FULL_45_18]
MPDLGQKPNLPINKWRIANLGFEMGFIIALPLLVFILVGKWLDAKFNSTPWLTLTGIVLAITLTTTWLTKRLKEYIK